MFELPGVLTRYCTVKKVIIHVGTNGVPWKHSELLKHDFFSLFEFLKKSGNLALLVSLAFSEATVPFPSPSSPDRPGCFMLPIRNTAIPVITNNRQEKLY